MRNVDARLRKLEAARMNQHAESLVTVRPYETTLEALARYEREGVRLAPAVLLQLGEPPATPEEWARQCLDPEERAKWEPYQ